MNTFEKSKICQDYLVDYAYDIVIDHENEIASKKFAGAIFLAAAVLVNQLMLGGAYRNNQDIKVQILDHLKEICHLLQNCK